MFQCFLKLFATVVSTRFAPKVFGRFAGAGDSKLLLLASLLPPLQWILFLHRADGALPPPTLREKEVVERGKNAPRVIQNWGLPELLWS